MELYNPELSLSNLLAPNIKFVLKSLLTFFIGPLITRPFFGDHPDQCVAGFLLGFTFSVLLWMKFGKMLVK